MIQFYEQEEIDGEKMTDGELVDEIYQLINQ